MAWYNEGISNISVDHRSPQERMTHAMEVIAAIMSRWEAERLQARRNAHKGQLYTTSFEFSGFVHIDFTDNNYHKGIPKGAIVHIPYRKASSLHVTNQSDLSQKIKLQTNTDEVSADATTELEQDEAIEVDGRGYNNEPILKSINLLVSSGTDAKVRIVIRA